MVASSARCSVVRRSPRPITLVGLAVACALAAQGARAAESAEQSSSDDKDQVRETVVITANGSQVDLPPDYAGGQIARGGRLGLFGNIDMMNIPFDSTNYTAQYIRDQQANSVADIVQGDPAVRVARGFGNFQELYVVRGFPIYSDDMSYDGLYGLLPRQYVASEFLERVEVFRGANTFLNGAAPGGSGIGGEFNLVPKRAPDGEINRLSAGYENSSQGYAAADFSRRFGDDRQWGVRVNVAHHGGIDSIDRENLKLDMASLGADFRGEHVRFSVDVGWQDHDIDAPRPSVTPTGAVPGPPKASSNFAQPWSFSEEHDVFGTFRGEYNFSDDAKVWVATGVRSGIEHNILANPSSDALGNTSSYRFDNFRKDLITTSEVGVRLGFETGFIKHKVSVSGSVFQLNSKNAYAFSAFFPGFSGNLYAPSTVTPPVADFFVGGVLFSPKTTSRAKTASVALADMLSFADDRVFLTLGAREQKIQQYSYDYNTGALQSSYDKSAVTPAVGLVVKPLKEMSLYANYIEGLVQGDTAPVSANNQLISNRGQVFSPAKSKQYEVGVKYDHGTLGGSLALFRITKPSALVSGAVYTEDGQQRNQGVEFSSYGEIMKGLRLLGGATYLNAETTRTQDGTLNGKKVIGVPQGLLNLGLEWDVAGMHGLTVDGRLVYTSSQWVDGGNTESIPAWTRLDLGGRYSLAFGNTLLTVRANIENVTNKDYWSSVGGEPGADYLVLAAPRTFLLSLSVDL
jgi:iron complex outermembrane recepter protein